MPSDFFTQFVSGLDEMTAELGESFTYQGVTYTGIINTLELSTELKEGGLMEVFGTQIMVPKTQLATEPTAGQTLFIGTQKARIIKVGGDAVSWELTCVSASH